MYDPHVVDTFIAIHRDIAWSSADAPDASRGDAADHAVASRATGAGRPGPRRRRRCRPSLLAFVSLSRLASGEGSLTDVLALGSQLLGDVVPGATGAWFIPDPARDRLVVAEAFGPAAHALRGMQRRHRRAAHRLGRRAAAADREFRRGARPRAEGAPRRTPPLAELHERAADGRRYARRRPEPLRARARRVRRRPRPADSDGRAAPRKRHPGGVPQASSATAPDLRPAGDTKPTTPLRLVVGR